MSPAQHGRRTSGFNRHDECRWGYPDRMGRGRRLLLSRRPTSRHSRSRLRTPRFKNKSKPLGCFPIPHPPADTPKFMQAIRDNPSIKLAQRIAVRNIVSITNPENLDHRSRPALLRRRHGQHRISAGRGRRPERAVSADGLSFFWIETAPLAGRVPAMRDLSSPVERAGRTSVSVRWTKVLRERLTSSRGWIEGRKAVERLFPLFRRFRPFGQASARRA